MGEPLRISPEALRMHAANVDRAAEAVSTSHGAAAQTYLDRGSYGLMCQFMPEHFEPGMRDTVDGLAGSTNELHALAVGLRYTADTYTTADAEATNAVRSAYPSMRLPL
jgi:hypothetical protein